uniref:Major facilitator superfamily (MFS) profile domain-containing protein n=1 Tax=Arion vulgaris TaxID=1028688 RepID=A0A0B7B5K0_9EUPU
MPGGNAENPSQKEQGGWTMRMICITCVAYLIIPAMSYSIACLNAPSQLIKDFMNETELERTGEPLSASKVESLYGLLVAVIGIGAAIGSLTADSIAEHIGRKYAIYMSAVTGCIGTLLMALCTVGKSYEMLFVGRTINGLALGWGLSLAPPYIMEMCLSHQKGAAAMANIVSQSTAFFTAQLFGYEELLGNSDYWPYLIGFPVVLLGLQLVLLPFCPQNPRYLLIKKNDEARAIKALQIIRGVSDVKDDIKQIRQEINDSSTLAQISFFKLFVTPSMRRPLIIAIAMGLQQNWCGMNGILFFSDTLFKEVGVTGRSSRYATSGTGGIFVLGCIGAVFLGTRFGRKTIFIVGTAAIGIFSAVFSLTMIFQDEAESLKYVNIVVALLIMASYALGPVCVFWVILGELFPHSARGAGFGVAILCAFIGFFTHCYALPAMNESLSSYTFLVFAGIDAGMVVFCIFLMPETKGKSFADMAQSWTKGEENVVYAPSATSITNSSSDIVTEPHSGTAKFSPSNQERERDDSINNDATKSWTESQ